MTGGGPPVPSDPPSGVIDRPSPEGESLQEAGPSSPGKRYVVTIAREFLVYGVDEGDAGKKALAYFVEVTRDLQGEGAKVLKERPIRIDKVQEIPLAVTEKREVLDVSPVLQRTSSPPNK